MILKNELVDLLGIDLKDRNSNQLFRFFFNNQSIEVIGSDTYFTNKNKGIGVVFENENQLENIHIYIKKDGFKSFSGGLPMGIEHHYKLDEIASIMGNIEHESGGGEVLPIFGKTNKWIKYYFENCYVHFEINENEQLVLITLGLLKLA